jgi:AcrR family transcriptional regulator
MSNTHPLIHLEVRRGPVAHERRQQIIEAARIHFKSNGYQKTSVSELAQEIGVTSAYIYRFFESKQAIGEAVCAHTLSELGRQLLKIGASELSAIAKLRQFFETTLETGYALFIEERKMHDLVLNAVSHNWVSVQNHRQLIRSVLHDIVTQGRKSGEFERKTPIDEVVLALALIQLPFADPTYMQQKTLPELQTALQSIIGLALRSLAP